MNREDGGAERVAWADAPAGTLRRGMPAAIVRASGVWRRSGWGSGGGGAAAFVGCENYRAAA
ncbi:hypothetical protein AB0G29_29600 [Streptomyces parvus]|uniref:hypothetical protein n=1 Tax=Streptomyces parvus TaxID=66428 RepID=UPI0033E12D50